VGIGTFRAFLIVMGVRDHAELDVWKLADAVRIEVRALAAKPAFARCDDLRAQLVRAAESPCANIAEGFSRYFPRDFARFVRIARGSLNEVIEHLGRARALGTVSEAEAQSVERYARRARAAAVHLVRYLESDQAARHVGQHLRRRN
jgi:four helix bundle protein